jgi:hypothetical protein
MPKPSKAELQFKAKYPHAHTRPGTLGFPVDVYAGDYLCAQGRTPALAFAEALKYEEDGVIKPDPEERRTEAA